MNVKKTKKFKEIRPENYHVHDRGEELPVREEIIEDNAGVISSVIVPTLAPVPEDAMDEESEPSEGSPN